MARTLYRLTDRQIRNLNTPGRYHDGGGLYLQVAPSGARSWVFRFKIKRRAREMGLGSLAVVSLADARAKLAACRALLAKGIDPIEEAKAEDRPAATAVPARPTFRDFAEEYVAAREADWRNPKHRAQWRATLARFAYPVIGDMALDAIDTPDVLRVIEPIWSDKTETASRLRGRIERILAAAAVRGLRPATNPARWTGHLREALPRKVASTPFAALPYAAVPAFMEKLHRRDTIGARALEFAVLTAARSGEARGATWAEIDLAAKVWTVPAERMKANRPHVVPLSDAASAVLDRVRPLRDLAGGYLFPGVKSGRPLSDMALTKVLRSMGYTVTAHGFRAAFKTWSEEASEYPNVVIESALAHIVGDKVEASYFRGDYLAKRRALMDDWGVFCASGPIGAVVPLRAGDASAA